MIRHVALVFILFLLLAMPGGPARADCTLPSLGETRPAGTLVLNSAHNVVQYCDDTVWRALIFNAGSGPGCFTAWAKHDLLPGISDWWESVAMSADGTTLIGLPNNRQLQVSTDGGVTWTARDSNRAWTDAALSADGTKIAAVAWTGQIYTSTDSGATWTPRDSARNWRDIASSSDGAKLVAVVGPAGQIYTSTDSGVTWTPRDSNRDWRGVASSVDGTKLAAVAYNGQVYTSTDSGVTWTPRDSNRGWWSIASSADGTNLVAAVNFGGQIYTSTDSGVTWTPREIGRNWSGVASSEDGLRLAAATNAGTNQGGQIYTSDDGGVTWTPRENTRQWFDLAMSGDGTKLAGAVYYDGAIYISECTGGGAPTAGLIAHWTFDEGSGTTAADSAGSNDGTIAGGATWTTGRIGQALDFDGANDQVNAGSDAALDNIPTITMSAWIRPDAGSNGGEIIDKTNNGSQPTLGPDLWIEPNGGNPRLSFAQGFDGGSAQGTWHVDGAIEFDEWQHVVVVYSRQSAANDPVFYVNGVQQTTVEDLAPIGNALDDSAEAMMIGVYGSGAQNGFFEGLIDDVRIYDRALSASEVLDLYNAAP